MKKIIKIISIAQALLLPGLALAQIPQPPAPKLLRGDLATILQNVINGLLGIAGVIAVVMLIIGGFRYAAAAGNEEAIEAAKKTITYAVIGLVIVALALLIVNTVITLIPK